MSVVTFTGMVSALHGVCVFVNAFCETGTEKKEKVNLRYMSCSFPIFGSGRRCSWCCQ